MKRWLLLAVAMMAVLGFAVACSNKKTSNGADTPTAVATTPAAETPMASTTPIVGETPQANAIAVNLTEWIVSPNPNSVAAGSVTFDASNIGGEDHELVIIKTVLEPASLPAKADGSVDEAGQGIEVIHKIEKFASKSTQSATVELAAGDYVLICNLLTEGATGATASHYANGMRAAFTVQ